MKICPQSKSTEKIFVVNIKSKGFIVFPEGQQHQGRMAGGEWTDGKHML